MRWVVIGALAPLVYVVVIKAAFGSDAAQMALAALICFAVGGVLVHYWEQDRAEKAALRMMEQGRWPMPRR